MVSLSALKGRLGESRPLFFRLSGVPGSRGFAKPDSIPVFMSGKEAKQVAVGNGTESFRTVAVVAEIASG